MVVDSRWEMNITVLSSAKDGSSRMIIPLSLQLHPHLDLPLAHTVEQAVVEDEVYPSPQAVFVCFLVGIILDQVSIPFRYAPIGLI